MVKLILIVETVIKGAQKKVLFFFGSKIEKM
jgi:hypothetical protein